MGLRSENLRVVAASLLTGLSACSSSDDGGEGASTQPLGLTWRPCGSVEGVECARVRVPLDYDRPGAATIEIAINRARALTPESRGVVFLNPGGPGAAGKPLLENSARALRALLPGFDFIGFDPRGTGESAPLRCPLDVDVVGSLNAGVPVLVESLRVASEACADRNGALFHLLGTNQVVADVDRIRLALGVEEINFFGISYGTRIGAQYALAYPEHARAIVLDAPVATVADITAQTQAQFDALLQVHAQFFSDCAAGILSCPPEPRAVFDAIVASQPTEQSRGAFLGNWQQLLSFPPGREILAQLLTQVASGQVMGTPEMPVMAPVNVLAGINAFANLSTNCADNAVPPPVGAEAEALVASFRERAPEFPNQVLPALTCSGWAVRPDPVPALDFTPRVPPLVIGGSADSLTPLQWAVDTAAQLPGASLLLSEHYGHSALIYGTECVFDFVREYLENLTPVPEGATCPAPR
jgi:pimeloyl-ACP methyl ester carboxylesterase